MNFSHYKMTLNWGISRNDWNDKLIDDDRGRIESHLLFYGCVATSLEICAKSCCVRKISKEDLKQKQWEARRIKNVPCFLWHLWETNYLGKFIHIQPLWQSEEWVLCTRCHSNSGSGRQDTQDQNSLWNLLFRKWYSHSHV